MALRSWHRSPGYDLRRASYDHPDFISNALSEDLFRAVLRKSVRGEHPMMKDPRTKRKLSFSLLVLGGLLMFLAPENMWIGAVLFGLGVIMEIAGAVLRQRREPRE
jgi:hypothetical protein